MASGFTTETCLLKINWISYYYQFDGYGRFSSNLVKALQGLGHSVTPFTMDEREMPSWMQSQKGFDWNDLTISMLPPYYVKEVPGRQWLYTMCEGSLIPASWVDFIHDANLERVIVPCEHNRLAFLNSGVRVPISVVPGGTSAKEFPLAPPAPHRPYTFLTIADRGFRKGWEEVWSAFYIAFGGKTTGNQNVRLLIKSRAGHKKKTTTTVMASGKDLDQRVIYDHSDPASLYNLYVNADCLALPSRSEGWGMPHREAAMMGIPVITQQYAGLDDGFTSLWSLPVEKGTIKPIPKEDKVNVGVWRVVDKESLAEVMLKCYNEQVEVRDFAFRASLWLRLNQTWKHSALKLLETINNNA